MKKEKMEKFTLTKTHLKLLRRFEVGWQDCEFGAPEIDPKRPYGNSDVEEDMREILPELPLNDEECCSLHKETQNALQIVLRTGKFKAGDYEREEYGVWELVNK